jgi:hypothetical protein
MKRAVGLPTNDSPQAVPPRGSTSLDCRAADGGSGRPRRVAGGRSTGRARELRPGPRSEPSCGGLVAFIQFRFGDDGYRLFIESLETAAVGPVTPETFVADAFTPPPTWVDDPWLSKWRNRRRN